MDHYYSANPESESNEREIKYELKDRAFKFIIDNRVTFINKLFFFDWLIMLFWILRWCNRARLIKYNTIVVVHPLNYFIGYLDYIS